MRDGGLHLCHSPGPSGVDVCADSVATMHNEGAPVHPSLRCFNEIFMVSSACPCCVDVGVRMENRLQIFPFTRVSVNIVSYCKPFPVVDEKIDLLPSSVKAREH